MAYPVDSSDGTVRTKSGVTGASADQTQGNIASGATDSGNPVKIGGVHNTTLPTLTNGQRGDVQMTTRGLVMAKAVFGATNGLADGVANTSGVTVTDGGHTLDGFLLTGSMQYDPAGGTWVRGRGDAVGAHVVNKGATSGGLLSARVVTGTTGVIKASAGQLYSLLSVLNGNAAVRYLHLYDKATAPTLSTDTPILTIALAASSVQNAIDLTTIGAAFANGIAWAYTTDNIAIPTTAGTSTELMFSGVYK